MNILDPDPAPPVCRWLRTKQNLGTYIDGAILPWESGANTAAAYWCLHTSGPVGPDDGVAHPHECRLGRVCFLAKDEDEMP
ncbi:MAG: hypothetical protein ACYC7A_12755 [Thermoanaerobaculia bacterium]